MATFRTLAAAALLTALLGGCAQAPAGHEQHAGPGPAGDRMAMMDKHMQAMREMHEKMGRAATPQERQALMAEHMKLMHDGMGMMGGMRGMGGMGMMGGDPAQRQQMMEKRMDMMQSMMQMMMDRMEPVPAPK